MCKGIKVRETTNGAPSMNVIGENTHRGFVYGVWRQLETFPEAPSLMTLEDFRERCMPKSFGSYLLMHND